MIKVKNINGTSDNTPPRGYLSWKSWWETKKNRKFNSCSCSGCINSATVGAHVQKAGSPDRKWYIVPLCAACNKKPKGEEFDVREYDLVAVNP